MEPRRSGLVVVVGDWIVCAAQEVELSFVLNTASEHSCEYRSSVQMPIIRVLIAETEQYISPNLYKT